MLGFMLKSTHEAELQKIKAALGYGDYRYLNPIQAAKDVLAECGRHKARADAAESQNTPLKAEIHALKARIAELEKPVAIAKAKASPIRTLAPRGKEKPAGKAAKVPVKGKAK